MLISKFPLWICALMLGGTITALAADTPAQAAARAALLEKMNELNGNPPAETPAPAQTAPAVTIPAETPAAVATPAPAVVETNPPAMEIPAATGTTPTGDTPAQAAARAALQQKMQELGGNPSPAPQSSAPAPASPKVMGERPIVAPALPISMSKEQKLEWLLSQYKADQLTPQQYHEQRAAILAQP